MKSDQERLRNLLKDTVIKLCTGSLTYKHSLSVEGLLAVTVDSSDIVLVHINKKLETGVSYEDQCVNPTERPSVCKTHSHHQQQQKLQKFKVTQSQQLPTSSESNPNEIHLKVPQVRSLSDITSCDEANSNWASRGTVRRHTDSPGTVRRHTDSPGTIKAGSGHQHQQAVRENNKIHNTCVSSSRRQISFQCEVSRRKDSVPVRLSPSARSLSCDSAHDVLPMGAIKTEVTSDDEECCPGSDRPSAGGGPGGGGRLAGPGFGQGAGLSEPTSQFFSSPSSNTSSSQDDALAVRQGYPAGLGMSVTGGYTGYTVEDDTKPVGLLGQIQGCHSVPGTWTASSSAGTAALSVPATAGGSAAAGGGGGSAGTGGGPPGTVSAVNTLAVSTLTWPHAAQALGMPGHLGLQIPAISTLLAPIRITNGPGKAFSPFKQKLLSRAEGGFLDDGRRKRRRSQFSLDKTHACRMEGCGKMFYQSCTARRHERLIHGMGGILHPSDPAGLT